MEAMNKVDSALSQEPNPGASANTSRLSVAFPSDPAALDQDQEWCVARVNGEWQEIRFHDYAQVYGVPGLYEHIFRDLLKCDSPKVVSDLLHEELQSSAAPRDALRALDLGAGNGLVGEELTRLGAELVVGVDIIAEARQAAHRDRPGTYDAYHVVDMTRLTAQQRSEFREYRFNCLTCVAALGFGDIPTRAFVEAYNVIAPGSPVAFNINERFVGQEDGSGFSRLIEQMEAVGALSIQRKHRYPHRLAVDGESIYYFAVIGKKLKNFDLALSTSTD
jgi:predicted TPR repeat methyltransferase